MYFKDGNVIWLKVNQKLINSKFLYYQFFSDSIQNFIKTTSGIGTVGTYTIENAKKTPIQLPSLLEQEKIVLFIEQLYEKERKELEKLRTLQKQKQAFMQQMFI